MHTGLLGQQPLLNYPVTLDRRPDFDYQTHREPLEQQLLPNYLAMYDQRLECDFRILRESLVCPRTWTRIPLRNLT